MTINGLRLHYTEWGEAKAQPVVMLHGITGHARTWDHEAARLAARWRVLCLDQRGHGDSEAPPDGNYSDTTLASDLAGFVNGLALARFRLVGLSLGGRVAMTYAGSHPGRVERLVVVDMGPEIAPAGRGRVGAGMASTPERFATLEDAVAYARAGQPRYAEAKLRHRVTHGLRALADGGFTWKYDRALREAVRAGRLRPQLDLWPLWQAIDCPTLIVRGAESDVLAPETARRMVQTQPRARLVEVPAAGHSVPGDQPEAFQRVLEEFLA
jgi:pimeloyl-ACP methyl ester carboxylesterase